MIFFAFYAVGAFVIGLVAGVGLRVAGRRTGVVGAVTVVGLAVLTALGVQALGLFFGGLILYGLTWFAGDLLAEGLVSLGRAAARRSAG